MYSYRYAQKKEKKNKKRVTKKHLNYIKLFLLLLIITIILLISSLKSYLVILFSIFICSTTMLYKRYLNISIGADFCLIFVLLNSTKFGPIFGAMVGGLSFFLGMFMSMEITKSPMMTVYGTCFYTILGLIYSFFPVTIIYNIIFLHIISVNVFFTIGAHLLGAPMDFLIRYMFTNTIANLLFVQIFGSLLKLVF